MAKLTFCLLTENLITDSVTNLVSAMNIVEALQGPTLPAIRPLLHFLIYWRKEGPIQRAEKVTYRVTIKYPTQGSMNATEEDIVAEIPEGKKNLRSTVRFEGVPLKEEGTMEFIVKQLVGRTWKKVGMFPLDIKKITV